jgi:hypothetical protein
VIVTTSSPLASNPSASHLRFTSSTVPARQRNFATSFTPITSLRFRVNFRPMLPITKSRPIGRNPKKLDTRAPGDYGTAGVR